MAMCCFCRNKRLEHLQKEHPDILCWGDDPAAVTRAVSLLCEVKVAAWQLKAEQLMRQHQTLVWLQGAAGDNCRTEVKHMRKQSNQLCRDMRDAVTTAAEWEQQRCRYQQTQEQRGAGKPQPGHALAVHFANLQWSL